MWSLFRTEKIERAVDCWFGCCGCCCSCCHRRRRCWCDCCCWWWRCCAVTANVIVVVVHIVASDVIAVDDERRKTGEGWLLIRLSVIVAAVIVVIIVVLDADVIVVVVAIVVCCRRRCRCWSECSWGERENRWRLIVDSAGVIFEQSNKGSLHVLGWIESREMSKNTCNGTKESKQKLTMRQHPPSKSAPTRWLKMINRRQQKIEETTWPVTTVSLAQVTRRLNEKAAKE